MKEMDQFLRIAEARLKSDYPFAPQRKAIAAKMYVKWKQKFKHRDTQSDTTKKLTDGTY